MTGSIFDDRAPRPPFQRVWRALINQDADDLLHRLMVIIPEMDPSFEIGPCRWQSRDGVSLPTIGDECLVIFDNDNEPWIVAWWPYN
jgi:hypothetical protein